MPQRGGGSLSFRIFIACIFLISLSQSMGLRNSKSAQPASNSRRNATNREKNAESTDDQCPPCRLSFANSSRVTELRKELRETISEISVIEFQLVGVEFNRSFGSDHPVFDPNWWIWSRSTAEYYFSVPALDMDVISFRLLSKTVEKVEVEVEAYPEGCTMQLSNGCRSTLIVNQIFLIIEPLRKYVSKDKESDCQCASPRYQSDSSDAQSNSDLESLNSDVLCESSFLQSSALKWLGNVVVGWRCMALTSSNIQLASRSTNAKFMVQPESHQTLRLALFSIGTFLPILLFFYFYLYQPFPIDILYQKMHKFASFGDYHPTRTLFFRLTKRCDLATQATPCDHWIVAHENALVDYSSPAPFLRLWQRLHLSSLKLLFIAVYLIVHGLVAFWVVNYQEKKPRLAYLTTPTEILVNLYSIPVSWLFTNGTLWPFVFSVAIAALYVLAFVPLSIWFIGDTVFYLSRRCSTKTSQNHYREKWFSAIRKNVFQSRRPIGPTAATSTSKTRVKANGYVGDEEQEASLMAKLTHWCGSFCLRNLLRTYLLLSIVILYVVMYSAFHCIVYVLLGLIVHLEYTAPIMTGVVMGAYYVVKCFHRLTAGYSLVKCIMFDYALADDKMEYEAVHCPPPRADQLRRSVVSAMTSENEARRCGPHAVWLKQVVFFDEERGAPALTFKQLRELSARFQPFWQRLRRAIARLAFTLTFIGLLIFTVLAFKSNVYQTNTDILITSLISLLSALLPQVSELFVTEEAEKLKDDAFNYGVRNYLTKQYVEYFLLRSSNCECAEFRQMNRPENGSVPLDAASALDDALDATPRPIVLNYVPSKPDVNIIATQLDSETNNDAKTPVANLPEFADRKLSLKQPISIVRSGAKANTNTIVYTSPEMNRMVANSSVGTHLHRGNSPASVKSKVSLYDNAQIQGAGETSYWTTMPKRRLLPPAQPPAAIADRTPLLRLNTSDLL